MVTPPAPEVLRSLIERKIGSELETLAINLGDVEARVKREKLFNIVKLLKLDAELKFTFLVSVTATDYLDARPERYEVVYHLLSIEKLYRLRIKVVLPEEKPEVDSLVPLYNGANFMEREVFDMYGVTFAGHPDLRRILMYPEFVGYPLRKDYPVTKKQPRIPLRAPEVRNTALDMKREPLVKINSKNKLQGDGAPGDAGRFVKPDYSITR